MELYAHTENNTFLSSKTRDAITFLELLTTEYDVATANPPYTDSADFGLNLKSLLRTTTKSPINFIPIYTPLLSKGASTLLMIKA